MQVIPAAPPTQNAELSPSQWMIARSIKYLRTSINLKGESGHLHTDHTINHRGKSDIAELNKNMLQLPALGSILQK